MYRERAMGVKEARKHSWRNHIIYALLFGSLSWVTLRGEFGSEGSDVNDGLRFKSKRAQ